MEQSDTRPESPGGMAPSELDAGRSAGVAGVGGITYAVGDIHGRLDLLLRAVDAIQADLGGRAGRVIFLGDYVDRGPDSKGVVRFLMHAQKHGAVTCLKGNHEALMLEGNDLWLFNGGIATLKSYGGTYENIPQEHLDWMRDLPTVAEAAGRLFVHAGFFPGVELADQDDDTVMWIRDRFFLAEAEFADWPHIVHGHTPYHPRKEDPAEPELLSWRTNLDTAAFHTGVLTVGVFEGDGGPPARVLKVTMEVAGEAAPRQVPGEGSRDTPPHSKRRPTMTARRTDPPTRPILFSAPMVRALLDGRP